MSRQLAIRTGVVNRVVKEVASYEKESIMLKGRVEKMELAKEDEYEIRQQQRVLADSLQMIPESKNRLAKAIKDLQELIEIHEEDCKGTEELSNAKKSLEIAESSQ